MGKVQILTKEQQIILGEVGKNDFLRSHFYFTGGTALSVMYLHHRCSEDLDFFSQEKFDNQVIFTLMQEWGKIHKFTFESRFVDIVYIFNLSFQNKANLKVDFARYPYKRVEKGTIIDRIDTDSLLDIAINKLLTVSQRSDVKDFVDLYFLLQKCSLWDLIHGVRVKFNVKIEPLLLASDFLKVEEFEFLPKMIIPLRLSDLKKFFREKAREIGMRAVK